MDREKAIEMLPEAYRRALELREQGEDDEEVARHLSIATEAIPALFRIARAKLTELLADDVSASGAGEERGRPPRPPRRPEPGRRRRRSR